nr:acyl-CoA thioesterase II [Oryzibacter oryziterrae]
MNAVEELLAVLDLKDLGEDRFLGESPRFGWQRIFGGQVIAQSLVAATRTVASSRPPHSLNCYFLLGGDPQVPVTFVVERIRDGGSFSTRRVTASQHDRPIFTLSASFHVDEEGLEHQIAMPEVPPPEALPDEREFAALVEAHADEPIKRYWRRPRPLVLIPTDMTRYLGGPVTDPRQYFWVRTSAPLPDDPLLHRIVLAYLSDLTLLDTSLVVHGLSVFDPRLQVASLDHAMWFHRQARVDDWILYVQESPSGSGSRGFTRGSLFSRDGILIASVAQEGLIRRRR